MSRQMSFTILAGSELKDIENGLKHDIQRATGLDLRFTYSGTLDAVDRISAGGNSLTRSGFRMASIWP